MCAAVPAPELLQALLTTPGPSGYEQGVAAVWRAAAERFGARVTTDVMGSSVAVAQGRGQGPLLAVFGHIDEIGLIVTHVDDEGLLWFASVGGWDPQILVGQRVEVQAADGPVPGVVGRKPIHLLQPDDRKKVVELREMHIDVGARDGDEARGLVRAGDVAVIATEPVDLASGRLASRALDNRLGAYVALEAARLVAEAGGAPGDVAAVAAVQEEIGLHGAQTSAYGVRPGVAVAVDVTHATDVPGVDPKEVGGTHALGSGPVLARGATIHPRVFEGLRETAEAEGIAYTVEASGRGTGTDADVVHLSRAGVPTGVVSIPLRYMHSPVETVELADVEACARLIAAYAQRLGADADFLR